MNQNYEEKQIPTIEDFCNLLDELGEIETSIQIRKIQAKINATKLKQEITPIGKKFVRDYIE